MSMLIEVPDAAKHKQGDIGLEGIDFISDGNQYLTFCLNNEDYGVDILSVTEIRGWEPPTLIPNSPDYVRGVINLRGVIVPIMDLRIKFQIGQPEYTPTTVVIVMAVKTEKVNSTMGFVVDAVSDVLNAEEQDIKPAPAFGGLVSNRYIHGLVNVGSNVVTVLNVEQLLNLESEEMADVE